MIAKKPVDKYFHLYLIVGVIGGFLFPRFFNQFEGYVANILMLIIGLLFLKVDFVDVITHIRNLPFVLYSALITLIVSPILTFFVFKWFVPQELLIALVLLAALPAGITGAVITDIMNGKTPLSLSIVIVTNLFCVCTIPFIFLVLFKTSIDLNYTNLAIDLAKMIFIPVIFAKVLKRYLLKDVIIGKIQRYGNWVIMGLVSMLLMITIAFQSENILTNIKTDWVWPLQTLGILFIAFFMFQILGYFSVFWREKRRGKFAVSNSVMIMNNFLGVLLAIAFFPAGVGTIVIMSFIPWTVMIMAKHWYKRYLP